MIPKDSVLIMIGSLNNNFISENVLTQAEVERAVGQGSQKRKLKVPALSIPG